MSAVRVSQVCYDRYQSIKYLPTQMRDGIDKLARYFHERGEFDGLFISSLVPWNELVGEPNAGHAAISDLLISRAADAVLSANFDALIEQWASNRKIAMQGALDGREALEFKRDTNPLVKFHGCMQRGRKETLWTDAQLADQNVADRVKACSEWMRIELPGKDLLVIGFWTDWGYLNKVLADALSTRKFGSVTVVDPESSANLQTKAPALWEKLSTGTDVFYHVRASGADALQELRVAFSRTWLKRFYALGEPLLSAEGKTYSAVDPGTNVEDLYNCRRDCEGVPYNRAAQLKEPPPEAAQASFFHHLLIEAGATREGPWYRYRGKRVRVVQGAGKALNSVRERYNEPPGSDHADIIVCAGAINPAVPGSLMRPGAGSSIVRPSGGAGARWMTLEQARGELAI